MAAAAAAVVVVDDVVEGIIFIILIIGIISISNKRKLFGLIPIEWIKSSLIIVGLNNVCNFDLFNDNNIVCTGIGCC